MCYVDEYFLQIVYKISTLTAIHDKFKKLVQLYTLTIMGGRMSMMIHENVIDG